MQRQSLGSPVSKLQIHGGLGGEEEKRKGGSGAEAAGVAAGEEEVKAEKPIRSGSRPERSVHLIPILTILCLLVLYLCSHDPSPEDLESVGAAGWMLAAKVVSGEEIGRYIGAGKAGVSAVMRGSRRLKETEKRRHRKLGIL